MSEILENINTDKPIDNIDTNTKNNDNDIDADIEKVLSMKPKSKRKPLSEEAKQKNIYLTRNSGESPQLLDDILRSAESLIFNA